MNYLSRQVHQDLNKTSFMNQRRWRLIVAVMMLNALSINEKVSAQTEFNYYYPFESHVSLFCTMQIEKDTILLQGVFVDAISPFIQGMAFARVDSSGSLISYQRYYDPQGRDLTYSTPNNMVRLSDGRYLASAITLQDNALELIFLTPQFIVDTVFEYFANDPSVQVNFIRHVFEIDDGYLVFGAAQRLSFAIDGQIFRIKKNGELLWRKWYGLNNKDEAFGDVERYSDSTFVVASFHKPFPVSGQDKKRNTWIFEVDTNGYVHHEFVDPDPFSGTSGGLVFDEDHNIYYSGESIVVDSYNQHNSLGRIGMLDRNFHLQWKKEFGKNLSLDTGLEDMIRSHSNLIAVGTYVDTVTFLEFGTRRPHLGLTAMVSIDGDSICQRYDTAQWYTRISSYGRLNSMDTLSSGSIVACGEGRFGPEDDDHQYAWLVKMPNPPCEGLTVSNKEISNAIHNWTINPNPAKESALLYLDHGVFNETILFNIFNNLGQIVKKAIADIGVDQITIDLRNLGEGIYIVQSINKTGQLTGIEKLIIVK